MVGRASVHFQDVDLHAYIVGSDGRAYTAISGVPQPAARALLPLLPIGGLFAWLFALEEPGSENGFSITGEWGARMPPPPEPHWDLAQMRGDVGQVMRGEGSRAAPWLLWSPPHVRLAATSLLRALAGKDAWGCIP